MPANTNKKLINRWDRQTLTSLNHTITVKLSPLHHSISTYHSPISTANHNFFGVVECILTFWITVPYEHSYLLNDLVTDQFLVNNYPRQCYWSVPC